MASFNISSFRSNLVGGSARPSLFEVELQFPSALTSQNSSLSQNIITNTPPQSKFLVKGASIPGSTIGTYDVFFHGKAIKIAGDRTFETWETTIINDEGFEMRHKIEKWMELIQNHTINTRSIKLDSTSNIEGENAGYKKDISVKQYSQNGSLLREYEFIGAFPTTLGSIALDWATSSVEEFTCTWAYDRWNAQNSESKKIVGV